MNEDKINKDIESKKTKTIKLFNHDIPVYAITFAIFKDWIIPIVLAILITISVNKFAFYKVYIPSGSMIPTLNIGDHVFVTRIYDPKTIKRGDILVFDSEELNEKLIKRVIGLPGDKISIKDGVVTVNGTVLQDEYVKNKANNSGEYEVPSGKYFFLGDNRAISLDSSKWLNSYIDGKDIKAKAQLRVYPFSDFGFVN